MGQQYQQGELLHLRASPLVCKPAGLPSVEEWMGPLTESNQRRPPMHRGKTDDPSSNNDTAGARSSLYENRHSSRTSIPSDIVLGPPKTAFASATSARNPARNFDSPNRTAFGTFNGDTNRRENNTLRDKTSGEVDKVDDEELRSRETRHNRRTGKEDGDSWSSLRSGKGFGSGDDRSTRKVTERSDNQEKSTGDSGRPQQKNYESHRRDITRDNDEVGTSRRNGNGRGNRPSWYRDDEPQEGLVIDGNKEGNRVRDWRDGDRSNRRGVERDWARGNKVEQDPEWMLEADSEDKKQTHTVDDIEKWKASMRANRANNDQALPAPEPPNSHTRTTSGALLDQISRRVDKPLMLDPIVDDKFFGLWNEPGTTDKLSVEKGLEEQPKLDTGRLNAPKSSKFSGFFSPKPEPTPSIEPLPPPQSAFPLLSNSSSEDKEGFQRILQMLGGGNSMPPSATAQSSDIQSSKPDHLKLQFAARQRRTPPTEQSSNKPPTSPPILSPRSRKSITLENLLGSQSPGRGSLPPKSDSEFLLNLMRPKGSDMKPPEETHQKFSATKAPGILPHPNLMNLSHLAHRMPEELLRSRSYYDPPIEEPHFHEKINQPQPTSRRIEQRESTFDDFSLDDISQRQSTQHLNLPLSYAVPPGLQRVPPGFDQLPPNFPSHLQQQRGNMVAPPPGFQNPNPASRGSAGGNNPGQFPPGLIPNHSSLNMGSDNRGGGSGGGGLPFGGLRQGGGHLLPPGFMAMEGMPPPMSYGPMGSMHEDQMSPGGRAFFNGRGPMDMFDGFGSVGGRGGALPGQFRRQE